MNILITGGNGFVASQLVKYLPSGYNITTVTRQDFDLTAFEAMNNFFQGKYFDAVIHCAVQGGSRLKEDTHRDVDVNLTSYYNLLQHKSHYNKLIYFGSGAEVHPNTPYGLSKYIINQSTKDKPNFHNLRIYGVFDENEWETRFIKTNIKKYISNKPMEIYQNKYMDFFYMEDLVSLVELYILNDNLPKEIDCTYCKSKTLYHITEIINHLNGHQVEIKINNSDIGIEYIGKFTDLGMNYIGLENGIKETYNKLKNEH